jgi:para-aminobenzoate synthetase component 2
MTGPAVAGRPRRILVVDNYDSFVHTIVGYLQQLGAETVVVRNDAVPDSLAGFDGVLISPGPGTPKEAGASIEVIEKCAALRLPMMGVCLGHQALGEVFGGLVTRAPDLMHGKTSLVEHDGTGVFAGLPSPLRATRYHSLAVEPGTISDELVPNAFVGGLIMAMHHRDLPLHAVQFHPESILTEGGHRMLANWLAICGDDDAPRRSEGLAPLLVL